MHLLAERFVFGGDDPGFLKEGVKTSLMAPILSFTSIVYVWHKPFFFNLATE
jgi:hypothetical protein